MTSDGKSSECIWQGELKIDGGGHHGPSVYFGFSQWYDVEYQPNPTMHCQVLNSHAHGSVNYLNKEKKSFSKVLA